MSWQEVCPGVHRRSIGENEQFIKFVGDRSHLVGLEQWSITTWARFKPCDDRNARQWTDTLREAWKHLRFRYPSIAQVPGQDGEVFEYIVPDTSLLSDWVKDSFFVAEDPTIDVDNVLASLTPSPLLRLYWLPSQWKIILHTPHWRSDGYAAFCLLDAFFECVKHILNSGQNQITSLNWGEEVSRLVPSIESALLLPTIATPEVDAEARAYVDTVKRVSGAAGLPRFGDLTRPPGRTSHAELRMSPPLTEALEKASAKHGFTIYSAVHAAVAAVNWKEASTSTQDRYYASVVRLNLRNYLPSAQKAYDTIPGLYSGGYTFAVLPEVTFLEHARQYEAERQHGVTKEFLRSRRQYAKLLLQSLKDGEKLRSASSIDSFFVSDVDKIVRTTRTMENGSSLEVSEIGLGVSTLTPQPFCFYMKFRDEIYLQLWYNEAYYDEAFAQEILKSIHEVLVAELIIRD